MATLSKGQATGKTDMAYTQIKVGDLVKNRHSGLMGTVNKYGHIETAVGPVKNWKGDDYVVVKPYDPADDLPHPKKQKVEIKEHEEEIPVQNVESSTSYVEISAPDVETIEDAIKESIEKSIESITEKELAEAQTESPSADQLVWLADDQILVDELRRRGFTVSATKKVEVITYEIISL